MSDQKFCPNCGGETLSDWRACATCNYLLVDNAVSCNRCHQLIAVDNPTYCPYCQLKFSEKKEVQTQQSVKQQQKEQKIRASPVITEEIERDTWNGMLKFNTSSMYKISGNTGTIAKYSDFLIWSVGLLTAITYLILELNFLDNDKTQIVKTFLQIAIVVPASLYAVPFFTHQLMKTLDMDSKYSNWKNLIASYFPLFVAKDILVVLVIYYVRLVGDKHDVGIPVTAFVTLMIVLYTFVFFQFVVLLKNWMGISGLVSIFVLVFVYYFSFILTGYYLFTIIDHIVEVLIWQT